MHNPRGSTWRKWDLHVHTPASLVHSYGGGDSWDRYLTALEQLPSEFKVIGINDYLFLDGYKRVIAEKAKGRLRNIDLILPVIELRLDKFGGSKNSLSRVNYHILFSNEIPPEVIESQFLSALSSKYILSPQFDELRTSGRWAATPTRASLEDLGRMIIGSVPEKEKSKYGAPLSEGFNNLCISLGDIRDVLDCHYFEAKILTGVGKTEWADIKWNDHSIADKKTIINEADLVFVSAETPSDWAKAKSFLRAAGVNDRLLDCSDAHNFADAEYKDRLGKCFTWIKADPTFEGLRQAMFEYESRIQVTADQPLEPLLQIKRALITFPPGTQLQKGEQSDEFCFRANYEVQFSPYFTCVIGGRGTGKSTLLNLLHEKLAPGSADFFKENELRPVSTAVIESCVSIEGTLEEKGVEFLQQNEIEQFATDPSRFTPAIFARLSKLDPKGTLSEVDAEVSSATAEIKEQEQRLKDQQAIVSSLRESEKELTAKKALIESFQSEEYKRINDELAVVNRELQSLRNWRTRLDNLIKDLRALQAKHKAPPSINPNAYEQQFRKILAAVDQAVEVKEADPDVKTAEAREQELSHRLASVREELEVFLKGRGLSAENLADVGKANERAAEIDQILPAMKERADTLAAEIELFTPKRTLARKYAETVAALLAPINSTLEQLSTEVKPIELRYEFDDAGLRHTLIQHIQQSLGEEVRPRIDHLTQMLEQIDFINLTSRAELLSKISDTQKTAKTLRDFFSNELNFKLICLEVEKRLLDVKTHGRIRVSYDAKPVENTSFGQRCTTAIVVLLLLGNTPIVIDEPEAHLDSALIAKYLVQLVKTVKNDRQIIFATHNANFVINGDAELIHILTMGDDKISQITSTAIENLEHRSRLLALEGGKEAFQRRELRYGIE